MYANFELPCSDKFQDKAEWHDWDGTVHRCWISVTTKVFGGDALSPACLTHIEEDRKSSQSEIPSEPSSLQWNESAAFSKASANAPKSTVNQPTKTSAPRMSV